MGRMKSFKKNSKGYITSNKDKNGWYLTVNLYDDKNKCHTTRIHTLVAKHFIGEIPKGYHVHHIDGNKQNNKVTNLSIISAKDHNALTLKENPHMLDGMINYNRNRYTAKYGDRDRRKKKKDNYFFKGKILQLDLNGKIINAFYNAKDAQRETGVCSRNILQVANKTPYDKKGNFRRQAGGYIWKYEVDVYEI